jgi:hypothetical protein
MKNPVLDTAKEKAQSIKENIVTAIELAKEYPEDKAIITEMVMPYYYARDKAEYATLFRVLRGGSWNRRAWNSHVSDRSHYRLYNPFHFFGFRLVKTKKS